MNYELCTGLQLVYYQYADTSHKATGYKKIAAFPPPQILLKRI